MKLKNLEKFAKKNDVDITNKKGKKADFSFYPSGIAVHPVRQDVFIISAKSPLIIIINKEGDVIQMESLDSRLNTQPEG